MQEGSEWSETHFTNRNLAPICKNNGYKMTGVYSSFSQSYQFSYLTTRSTGLAISAFFGSKMDASSSFQAMDEYQRQLAAHFAAGGTLEEAARKRRTWDAPAVKESLSMWQLGASVLEIEAEMKRRNYSIVEGTTVKQALIKQGQKI